MIEGLDVRCWRVMDYVHVVLRVRQALSPDRMHYTYVITDIRPVSMVDDVSLVSELGHLFHLVSAATTADRLRAARGNQLPSANPLVLRSE